MSLSRIDPCSWAGTPVLRWLRLGVAAWLGAVVACSGPVTDSPSGSAAAGGNDGTGGAGGPSSGGGNAASGGEAGTSPTALAALLDALRANPEAAMLTQSRRSGWPAPVEEGLLFVTTRPDLELVAGEHDGWSGTPMTHDEGFNWLVMHVPAGTRYKFTDGQQWLADPWSRAYEHDEYGLMSMVAPSAAHLERHFALGDATMAERTIRAWVPAEPATHVLYVHDGQNLFDPEAPWGGWQLQHSTPAGMLVVGVDNTPARLDEYTHVEDFISGELVGGLGDAYADFVHQAVRDVVRQHYGEPDRVGVLGSSLGGLVSFHIAQRHAGAYDFAASLSGTMGWGSIGLGGGAQNETMIERYQAAGHQGTALYLDSGGDGTCFDSDGDGLEDDDPSAFDNYCENKQFASILYSIGYVADVDVWYWWQPAASHDEAAWAERVWRPLQVFSEL